MNGMIGTFPMCGDFLIDLFRDLHSFKHFACLLLSLSLSLLTWPPCIAIIINILGGEVPYLDQRPEAH